MRNTYEILKTSSTFIIGFMFGNYKAEYLKHNGFIYKVILRTNREFKDDVVSVKAQMIGVNRR